MPENLKEKPDQRESTYTMEKLADVVADRVLERIRQQEKQKEPQDDFERQAAEILEDLDTI